MSCGGAGGDLDRRNLEVWELRLEPGDVLVELVGERRAALGGVLLEQQVLEPVPAGELRVVGPAKSSTRESVSAVDVGDQVGERLDALPRRADGA